MNNNNNNIKWMITCNYRIKNKSLIRYKDETMIDIPAFSMYDGFIVTEKIIQLLYFPRKALIMFSNDGRYIGIKATGSTDCTGYMITHYGDVLYKINCRQVRYKFPKNGIYKAELNAENIFVIDTQSEPVLDWGENIYYHKY